MGRHLLLPFAVILAVAFLLGQTARAQLIPSGTITLQQCSPGSYTYSLTLSLDSASDNPVSCYWFAWIPGYDFLPSNPTAFESPDGWTAINAPDSIGVASVIWSTSTDALQPGQTLGGFSFTTPDPPSVIYGTSDYLGLPVLESYVYKFTDARGEDAEFVPTVVAAVPEPRPAYMLILAALLLLLLRPARCRGASPLFCRMRF